MHRNILRKHCSRHFVRCGILNDDCLHRGRDKGTFLQTRIHYIFYVQVFGLTNELHIAWPQTVQQFWRLLPGQVWTHGIAMESFFPMTTGSGRRLCSNKKWEKHSKVASWLSNIFYNLKGLVYLAKQKHLTLSLDCATSNQIWVFIGRYHSECK